MGEDRLWPDAAAWLGSASPEPDLLVVGVPTSAASLSPSEAGLAPTRLRAVLARFSTYHSELGIDLRSVSVADQGDLPVHDLGASEAMEEIEQNATRLPGGSVLAFLGGDNAITLPLVIGVAGEDIHEVGVLTLDAHHDVRTMEQGPSNGSPMRGLVEAGIPDSYIAQVGIHSFANSGEYRAYCDDHEFFILSMEVVDTWGISEAIQVALEHLSQRCRWIYVDFDLDVLDAAYAPACPGARPGGMTPRQLSTAAWICGRHPKVGAADFVEVDPTADVGELTLMSMAHVFLSFCAGVAGRPSAGGDE